MEFKNVTVRLPEPLVRKARVYAAERNESMTSLITSLIEKLVTQNLDREARRRRLIERMENAEGHGGITWKREDLYRY